MNRCIEALWFGDWWWRSWALGIACSIGSWVVHMAIVISARGTGPDYDMSLLAGAIIIPLAGTMLIPCFYLACGFLRTTILVVRGRYLPSRPIITTPAAFFMSWFFATVVFYATRNNIEDVVSGFIINCMAGQLSLGIYVPFSLWAAAAFLCARAKSKMAMCAWIGVGSVGCFAGSALALYIAETD